jgi:phenylalanyl-tRNA synthetase alpha chain
MIDKITQIKKEIQHFSIRNEEELEAYRLEFLSRNGKIQKMFGLMGSGSKRREGSCRESNERGKKPCSIRF